MAKTKLSYPFQLIKSLKTRFSRYWKKNLRHKIFASLIIFLVLLICAMYGISKWYNISQESKPLQLGVSFDPDYAQSLGLNPEQNMKALLNIGVRQFRINSYWNDVEPEPNQYNFTNLDWEFKLAQQYHAKIILVVGLRQPRWPECHPPSWINTDQPEANWQPQLEAMMTKVINRYKDSSSLQSYQLENEYFLKGFGTCSNYTFSRERLVSEDNLIKKLDPSHPIIIPRSNNTIGWPTGQPQSTTYSISIYRRVWDARWTHRYFEYPWPGWYYGFVAGIEKLVFHKSMVVDELQAEPWPPEGKSITQISLAEQSKSMNASRLKGMFQYGKSTGMKQLELWGGEYWYYRMEKLHDPSLWNVAKQEFENSKQ
jgi:hypothetical protein